MFHVVLYAFVVTMGHLNQDEDQGGLHQQLLLVVLQECRCCEIQWEGLFAAA